jgi:hypothetical protein
MPKFNVREGFVVAYTDQIKQGDKVVARDYAFYPEDGPFDLDETHARDHAHKLEGADKDGKALLAGLVRQVDVVAPTIPLADVQGMIAAAVAAAMQQVGFKPAAPAA